MALWTTALNRSVHVTSKNVTKTIFTLPVKLCKSVAGLVYSLKERSTYVDICDYIELHVHGTASKQRETNYTMHVKYLGDIQHRHCAHRNERQCWHHDASPRCHWLHWLTVVTGCKSANVCSRQQTFPAPQNGTLTYQFIQSKEYKSYPEIRGDEHLAPSQIRVGTHSGRLQMTSEHRLSPVNITDSVIEAFLQLAPDCKMTFHPDYGSQICPFWHYDSTSIMHCSIKQHSDYRKNLIIICTLV